MVIRVSNAVRWAVLVAVVAVVCATAQEPVPMATASAMARVAKKVAPEYPQAARQLNVQGSQEVAIVVNAQGDVEDVKVIKGNAMFSVASVSAVKQWKFTPLVKDGQSLKFSSVLLINYQK